MSYLDRPLVELNKKLNTKELTSLDLVRAVIKRQEANSDLNCFIDFDIERLEDFARTADKKRESGFNGSLLGIPIAYKDMILTRDIQTTAGSKFLSGFTPPYNAHVVECLETQGAICAGKTNQDEFAMGSSSEHSAYGVVRNPWDHDRVPGGSSGGSAAAVAAGVVPVALGTDTGGSVRQPAAFCGIIGLKPTYGRVSRYGVIAYASSLDQVGVLARNVTDCANIFQVIAGKDQRDATSVDKGPLELDLQSGSGWSGVRIGVPKEYFGEGIDPEVLNTIRITIDKLADAGASIVDISLPHTELAVASYYIIAPAEASSNLARYDGIRFGVRAKDCETIEQVYRRSRSEGFGAEVKQRILIGTYVLSKGYYDAYYRKAQKIRTLIAEDFANAFGSCDVIMSPVAPTTAFKLGSLLGDPLKMYLSDACTVPVNLAGLPAMSVPCGLDSNGLPIGLQMICPAWQENRLLQYAFSIEELLNLNLCPPSR